MTVSIMQPYLLPYAGYYRLLKAQVFVIYDCVQFIRRGRIHRNELLNRNGQYDWFTLPIEKPGFHDRIDYVRFVTEWESELRSRAQAFPSFATAIERFPSLNCLFEVRDLDLIDYLERQLIATRDLLGLPARIIRSSSLNIPESLKGQDRILEICRQLNATDYVNVPGGVTLYQPEVFRGAGIELHILTDYKLGYESMLDLLATKAPEDIRTAIDTTYTFI